MADVGGVIADARRLLEAAVAAGARPEHDIVMTVAQFRELLAAIDSEAAHG